MSNYFTQKLIQYIPLVHTLRNYRKEYIKRDVAAALTVAIVAVPQSMAYALIAGLDPVYGLYTAIIGTVFCSVFGSSSHLIAGPTNAISLLIAASMKNFMGRGNAYEMLFLLTFMVGAAQILFGLFKLGRVIHYVSHAVVVGFTAGAGVLIAMGQLNSLAGISIKDSAQMPAFGKVIYVLGHMDEINYYALGLAVLTIAIIIACKKINKNIPGPLLGIVISVVITVLFSLERHGVRLTGSIPSSLPRFSLVRFDPASAKELFSAAMAIAIIGLVEAISIAKSISSTSYEKIDANQEFIGQGIANVASSFFHGFPGSGSFTRSAVNYYSGAATRIAGILSGAFVAVMLMYFAPYAKYIPSPSLAGVIMVIAYGMVNKKEMKKVYQVGKSDSLVMWITFGATVLMPDLDWAIYAGIAISIILYLRDTNQAPVRILVPVEEKEGAFSERETEHIKSRGEILIVQLEGNLYFGSAHHLERKLESLVDKSEIFILRMKRVVTIDITALDALQVFIRRVKEGGGTIIVCGIKTVLNEMLLNAKLYDLIGGDNIFLSEEETFASSRKALDRARGLIKGSKEKDYAAD